MTWREIKHRWRTVRARADIAARWRDHHPARPHGLPWPLVVSLTSYPRRFPILALTLRDLLRQTVQPDATILWLARGDAADLPSEVLALRAEGLTIAETSDLRSYKKIVPALEAYPEAAIVTADDDLYLGASWLERLVEAAKASEELPCHRAHRIVLDAPGHAAPYAAWERSLRAPDRGPRVFPTGGLGIVYPPGSLHEDATRADLFQELCPTADDVWLWWMHRLAGRTSRQIGGRWRILEWPDSQGENLRAVNVGTGAGNDQAVAAMTARYGLPVDGG